MIRLWIHAGHLRNEEWSRRCVLCQYEKVMMIDTDAKDLPNVWRSRKKAMRYAGVS